MTQQESHTPPWWLGLYLWGLDAPLFALAWGFGIALSMEIVMIAREPLMLLFALVWFFTLASRFCSAALLRRGAYVDFYRSRAITMLLQLLIVLAASLWMLLCNVGSVMLNYAIAPLLILLAGHLPLIARVPLLRGLSQSAALALACAIPACYLSVVATPVGMLARPSESSWNMLMLLLFLFFILRLRWQGAGRQSAGTGGVSPRSFRLVMLIVSGVCLARLVYSAPTTERPGALICTVGMAVLWLLLCLSSRCRRDALCALAWPLMALPPLLLLVL